MVDTSIRSTLPPNQTVYEKGLDAQEERLLKIPVPLRDLWNPATCPVAFLPFLAYGLGVDLWDESWTEGRKRRICAEIIAMKRLKGTLEGVKRYLSYVDATIIESVTPPQEIFAMPYDPARRDAFRVLFAQLRIYPFSTPGLADGPKMFAGASYVGHAYAMTSTALQRYGRRATIWDKGVETEVKWTGLVPGQIAQDVAFPTDSVIVPASASPVENFAGRMYAGAMFASRGQQSRILSLDVDRGSTGTASPEIGSDQNQLQTLDAKPELVYDTTTAQSSDCYPGKVYAGRMYARNSDAALHIYDRYYLIDQSRVPTVVGASYGPFVGRMRVGIKPFSARFRINRPLPATQGAIFAGRSYAGRSYAKVNRDSWSSISAALRAASVYRDTLFYTTATKEPLNLKSGFRLADGPELGTLQSIAVGRL